MASARMFNAFVSYAKRTKNDGYSLNIIRMMANKQLSEEVNDKRPQFGNRFLTDPNKVFQHNAWDNVDWDEKQIKLAEEKVKQNSNEYVAEDKQEIYEREAGKFWDKFYSQHQNRFFKDRHWLFTEFPELAPKEDETTRVKQPIDEPPAPINEENEPATKSQLGDVQTTCEPKSDRDSRHVKGTRMLEVGCGVGNTVFPILQTNNDDGLFLYCCDFSEIAVDFVKAHADYNTDRCHAFVCDITDVDTPLPFPENNLDIIIMIFVLSAIKPERMQATINRLARHLKPGGRILLRDYGRYDMAQLRFKKGRCLSENFYVRGDGTRVYFFTQDNLRELFTKAGLVEEQNLTDKRLQVNRGRQLTMYRVWLQCKYRKPVIAET
ncbi:tRNA N(3)-methylcytidine methyltransferase METTL2-like [Anneissia japonica]|uniref:tRNA N(3)-methylcytidine methyltransferase METTL2-like n=1 Tax=Anneissia japonica TaxID=1529436 RepID=UPI001425898F|nr:tRNA N(3)-methylcytidine methyltransferase METTL2-like [Anneissia japonica]